METMNTLGRQALHDYSVPVMEADDSWASSGSVALRDALYRGSGPSVTELLMSMDTVALQRSLVEAGFDVPPSLMERDRDEIFATVRDDLRAALAIGVDGFGLSRAGTNEPLGSPKPVVAARTSRPVRVSAGEGNGRLEAANLIQAVMRSSSVGVELLGPAVAGSRGSMQFVAGQALEKGLQGFAFDGIPGKYAVSLNMQELVDLHSDAAQAVAEESARTGLGQWAAGSRVTALSELVPDSIHRLLHGSLSVTSAQTVVDAIEGGSISRRAREVGAHTFTALLSAQGLDVNAKTIADQAQDLGLVIQEPDRSRGKYFGPVVGSDHRACLLKITREDAMELPFKELPAGQVHPKLGEFVSMAFKTGVLSVSVAKPLARDGSSR